MKKTTAVDSESNFGIHEMFFSTTDSKGIITSVNSVFERVSGHSLSTLVGSPQNIMRHPDMPKAIFKMWWENIQAGKPFTAYVKDLIADGSYLWTIATVFPFDGGYLAVRIKPTSSLFKTVPGLYAQVLEDEKKNGVESAVKLFLKLLYDAGFSGYDSFMNRALALEMKERSHALTKTSISRGEACFTRVFEKLEAFATLSKILTNAIKEMKLSFQGLRSLSLNMSLSACHLGKTANTLAVVADSFQHFSSETEEEVTKFQNILQEVRMALRMSEYYSSAAYLQNQMIDFFAEETKSQGINSSRRRKQLSTVSAMLIDHCNQLLEQTHDLLGRFSVAANTTEASITALEIVRQTGKVEAAQVHGAMEAIGPYLLDLQKFTKTLRTPLRKIAENSESLVSDIEVIQDNLNMARSA
ncbi:MAG: PAS domain-containing protein [Bdellovibrio sp.]|nr:PAS domain-containing protein [Bdellovibrio sp.]